MPARDSVIVGVLAALCTGALVVFLTAASTAGQFAPLARVGYFAVYLTGAAACLAAGRAAQAHSVRWQWLSPAIASIPIAIVAGRWSVTLSDFIALSFYPFAMLTAVRPNMRQVREALARRSLDVLLWTTAAATIFVYSFFLGLHEPSVYRSLAPGAAVLLAIPVLVHAAPRSWRRADAGVRLLFAGLVLAVITDITPGGVEMSPFTWAFAVWLMGIGAAMASVAPAVRAPQSQPASLPRGWWPAAAVATVYALIAVQLGRIESPEIRLLATGGTILTTLALVRQVVALRDNDELLAAGRAQEARFRGLVQHSTDAFVIIDAARRITYHSPALAALAGGDKGEYIGLPVAAVLAPDEESALLAMLEYVGEQTGRTYSNMLALRAGGRVRHVDVIATNRRDEPAIDGIVLNIRDITERVQFERQLARQDKMDAVGRMASGVAHEFNNLLTVIMGHVDLLSTERDREGSGREALDEIRHASERAAELTRSLLGVSRKRPEQPSVIDANTILRRVERMLRSGIGPEYAIVVRSEAALWPARSDADDFEHALLNLALNARDAMPDGGSLTITTANVAAERLPEGTPMPRHDYVRVAVQDTGVGMSEEVLARAFEPFFSTKPEGQGTGLGLSIVYAAVRRNGGFVDVSSIVGEGTTFTLWLPRA